MKIIKDLQQGTPEWHDFRGKGIGASEIASIMNISPWTSAEKLFRSKIGEEEKTSDNFAMKRGRELEPVVRELYETQMRVKYEPACAIHEEFDFVRCSFDGINLEESHLIEIKCPGEKTHNMAKGGAIPEYYFAQMQWQLMISNFSCGDYLSFYNGDLEIVPIFADKEYQSILLDRAKGFWQSVCDKTSPLEPKDQTVKNLIQKYKMLYEKQKHLEEEIAAIKKQLQEKINKDDSVKYENVSCKWIEKSGTVDYKSIPELLNVDLELYRKKPITYFEVKVVKP